MLISNEIKGEIETSFDLAVIFHSQFSAVLNNCRFFGRLAKHPVKYLLNVSQVMFQIKNQCYFLSRKMR